MFSGPWTANVVLDVVAGEAAILDGVLQEFLRVLIMRRES